MTGQQPGPSLNPSSELEEHTSTRQRSPKRKLDVSGSMFPPRPMWRRTKERFLAPYYLKPNQHGLGGHICNCGYIVSERARGRGIASMMCEHSQAEAVTHGFRGMQYNLVVSTNEGAIRLWKKHGFQILGTLPGAFRDPEQKYVDSYVMFKQLVRDDTNQDAESGPRE
jgi:RimJ/RimL family protein N-acetyltransferase